MSEPERVILHVDMDAFFAAVEQLDDPGLRGQPVLIGHDGPRGVVATASYEARPFGCHSAQPMSVAKRLCPQAVIVPHRGRRYSEVSRQVFGILRQFTPIVEPLSIDEAFLDVSGSQRLFGDGRSIARQIKQRIRDEIGLTASIGVSYNKFLAKLASDLHKPDGLTIINRDDIDTVVAPLSISRMWGIGPKAESRLAAIGVRTFADLRALPESVALARLGQWGPHAQKLARGEDDRHVSTGGGRKSVSHEQTFGHDLADPDDVRRVLMRQTERVAATLRKKNLRGRTVTVKIRFGRFETITRSHTLPEASCRTDELWTAACDLFEHWAEASFHPVRLIGMGVSHLEDAQVRDPRLFIDACEVKAESVDRATDVIRDTFGPNAIQRGSAVKRG